MGRKFLEKRPNSAFSSSKDEVDTTGFWNDLIQGVGVISLCECVHFPTGGAALADENAQSVAHRESQIRTFVNSHSE